MAVNDTSDCLITDQGSGICSAIQRLVSEKLYSGYHFYDKFHILKKLRIKGTWNNKKGQRKWSIISKMTQTFSKFEYDQLGNELI